VKIIAWLGTAAFLVAATPSPSPSLDGILAAPPAGFVEVTTAQLHGHFTAADYASDADASKQATIVATMNHDGFIDGYGRTWASQSTQHVMLEVVLAFTGGRGARDWLTAAEVADKNDPSYVREDTMSGLGTYYGAHLVDKTTSTIGDEFSFVKGNDVFAVAVVSTKEDALGQATTQAASQFSSAPEATIPSAQWPENTSSGRGFAYYLGTLIPTVLILAIVVGLVGFVVARRRRQSAAPAMAYAAPVIQMSPDGNFWWDGQAWRDASREAPPYAQRSGDGANWWDGRTWRPVPPAQPPQ
jgi:hypothetical protein